MSNLKQVLSTIPFLSRDCGKRESMALQNVVRELLPDSRVAACLRHRLGGSAVAVSTTNRGNIRLGGVMVCDAGHICPVCHARKMARERKIVSSIVHDHYQAGGMLVDAALTVPHRDGEPLSCVLNRLDTVWKKLCTKRIWKELAQHLGVIGCVRRLEVTLGAHGWHPHFHVSFLCDAAHAADVKGLSWRTALDDAFAIVSGSWRQAGAEAGVAVCEEAQSAVAIIGHVDAQKAVDYNTKNMGYCRKADSLTPMDLLRVVAQVEDAAVVRTAKRLFAEYAACIKRRHALSFTGSAKAVHKAAVEKADAGCAEVAEEKLGIVAPWAWSAIVKAGLRETLAVVKSRRELVAVVLRAALATGHGRIPFDWMRLCFETKTVISIKAPVPTTQ
ncbi:protein rep [Caballeronia zhejiangensis]|uniref:protein rep n=1 Tax=Caballeronia zhejiangensis TaxID=871203 RepID=UPI001EF3E170|nr:protein rep [Caballeronia zhejiangensis]MCG7399684.1 protein rep [Caballeronia zhejiangensis]